MAEEKYILGAISGDIIGSPYEFANIKSTDFEMFTHGTYFTDDSVLTVATMHALLYGKDYAEVFRHFGRRYPRRGYGGRFRKWLMSENPEPYGSCGNGSAMRVSPVGWYCESVEEALAEAKRSAEVTHDHPEGIKGAQSVAAAVFLARTGKSKGEIKAFVEGRFGYDLSRGVDEIRQTYQFDETCQGTVPQAMCAFLQSADFEDAIRLPVSLGGDSDTIAAITGGIAEAFYREIPEDIADFVQVIVGPDLMEETVIPFSGKYRKF